MKYYQDITLLPDAEVSLGFIWEKVYQQIHLMLVEHKVDLNQSEIGLSFPGYGDKTFPLGHQLRLLANTEQQLRAVDLNAWLQRLSDYVHIKSIKPVPDSVGEYACFYRHTPKSETQRIKQLERRVAHLAQKHGVDEDVMRTELLASIQKKNDVCKLPFINMQSLSTSSENHERHRFMLFIDCKKMAPVPANSGLFTCYGLSSKEIGHEAWVPCF